MIDEINLFIKISLSKIIDFYYLFDKTKHSNIKKSFQLLIMINQKQTQKVIVLMLLQQEKQELLSFHQIEQLLFVLYILMTNYIQLSIFNIKFLNIMKSVIVIIGLIFATFEMKFNIQIAGLEKHCFFEILQSQQKYSIETVPKNQPKYELQIANGQDGKWNSVYYKMTTMSYERVEVHKLATTSNTYSFCLKNLHRQILEISIKFQVGLQLLQFELLPDKTDAENLQRQITWLEKEKSKLYNSISRMEGLRSIARGITNMMSVKMICFAVLGLVIVLVVNILFYREMKRTFKERKLI